MCSLFVCLDVNHAGSLLLASSNQHRAGVQVFPPLMKSLVKSAAELCVCGGGILWILVLPVRFIPSLFYSADINDSFPALIVICHREAKATFLRTPADIWAHDWLRLCYPHWLKRENLGFKRMALPLFFYWKASANEQRNSCWAGCPHTA